MSRVREIEQRVKSEAPDPALPLVLTERQRGELWRLLEHFRCASLLKASIAAGRIQGNSMRRSLIGLAAGLDEQYPEHVTDGHENMPVAMTYLDACRAIDARDIVMIDQKVRPGMTHLTSPLLASIVREIERFEKWPSEEPELTTERCAAEERARESA